jgi:zinc/manganese transport system permease protein
VGLLAFTSAAGVLMGVLGDKLRGRDVAIGATLAFSLALGSLFLTMSTKLAGEAVNILFGNILAISPSDVRFVIVLASINLIGVGVMYRPLLFASLDPEIAEARGLPVRGLGIAFMVLLGFAVATAVQLVGVLLIFALLILPAATAQQLTARPGRTILYAAIIAILCVWLGLFIGFYLPYPPSFFITTLAFGSYLATRRISPVAATSRRRVAGGGLLSADARGSTPI